MSQQNSSLKSVRYAKWVIKNRAAIIISTILLSVLCAAGAKNLKFNNSYQVFFGPNNPQLQAFEKLQKVYSKNDNVLIAIGPKDNVVFSNKTLSTIEKFTEIAWSTPYSTRVDSITNFQHTYANEDDLFVENLISDASSLTPLQLEKAKVIATQDPLIKHRLISPEADFTAINITINLPDDNPNAAIEIAQSIYQLKKEIIADNPNLEIYLTGTVMLSNAFATAAMKDMSTLTPLMYLGIILIMGFILRSICYTFASLVVILFSALTGMGLAGWLGIELTTPTSIAPTIILTLAIADSIHILISYIQLMKQGKDKNEAIIESLRININPVFLTTLTTAIGFLSLNFSDAPPIQDLGNITAIGITAALIFSISFLPAMLSILPCKIKAIASNAKQSPLDSLANFVIKFQSPVLYTSIIVGIAISFFMGKIVLSDEFIKYFEKKVEFRNDTEVIMNRLTGIYQIEFSLDVKRESTVSDPEFLEEVEDFSNWLRQKPEVMHVSSITDIYKRLNRVMHNNNPEFYTIPKDQFLAAQYLLLYELSLPYGLDLNNQINIDKSATRLVVTLNDVSSVTMRRLAEECETYIKAETGSIKPATGGSPALMFSYISERNINSMIKGSTLALILITLALMFALRSFKYGIISIVPNLLPITMAFGLWGLLYQKVGFAIAVVGSVAIGIVVDDSVHFLSKYRRARVEMKKSPEDATRYAFKTVGVALFVTSIILFLGFSILAGSSFLMNKSMGILTLFSIVFALLADFFLLPTLLMTIEKKGNTNQITEDK